jgi:tetratricopeptide (TPR) repeat protein
MKPSINRILKKDKNRSNCKTSVLQLQQLKNAYFAVFRLETAKACAKLTVFFNRLNRLFLSFLPPKTRKFLFPQAVKYVFYTGKSFNLKIRRIPFFIFLIFFYVSIPGHSQNKAPFPRLEPDLKALEYNRLFTEQGFSWINLAEISLWASGDTSASNLEKIRAAAETIKKSPDLPKTDIEKAEFILNYMHKNILKSYSLNQTRVDTIFSGGRFNCVSSAVLYMIFCDSEGIYTTGVITKDHAFITVHIGETDIDVETTNLYGFDPGNKKEFHDSKGNVTGFSYVPPRNYRDRQTINKLELISVILNNRISELEKKGNYAEAVVLAVDRAALVLGGASIVETGTKPDDSLFIDPRHELMDRLFNYGGMILREGREEDVLRWTAAASSKYHNNDRWQELIQAAVNNRITKLIKAGKLQEAGDFLEDQKAQLSGANYTQLDSVVEKARQIHLNNMAIDYHNRFARAWNRKNYDEARRILKEGLSQFPNNSQLLADSETVDISLH